MDAFVNQKIATKTDSTFIFMQNKVFMDDIVNVAEVKRRL